MRTKAAVMLVAGVALAMVAASGWRTTAAEDSGPMLIHDVYFTLKDNSADAREKLVKACNNYLTKHPGEVFFAAGMLAEDLRREVNDRDWDVGLHIVFKDRASHDQYQASQRHQDFVKEIRESTKKVRVFDTIVQK
jgi:hypothetical protein